MDLTPTEEQRLLRESAGRFFTERYGFEQRRSHAASADGFSREAWAAYAELGWLGLAVPEAAGGLGAGAVETGIVMEGFGRALALEPYLPTAILAAGLITALGTEEQRQALLPAIAGGRSFWALAHAESGARYRLAHVAAEARRDGAGWRLAGRKSLVLAAPSAGHLLVSARVGGDVGERGGIGLFVVPADAAGLSLRPHGVLDGTRAAEITLDGVRLGAEALLGGETDALPALEAVIDRASAALAAEAVGCMQVLLDDTVAYTKTRVQFGRPLAENQVLRHRMADMAIRLEEARAATLRAALLVGGTPEARARAVSSTKVKVGHCARFVAEQAVQLHGGMGVTDELNVGAYYKRLLTIEALFGSPDHHLRRHAALARDAACALARDAA